MKKIFFATILLSVAFLAASCQKENNLNELSYGPITINAVTEGIDNPGTKASTAYKYDVLWGTGDQIIVKGQGGSDTFTLTSGAKTTMGIFKQDNSVALSGEVEGFYPVSIVSGTSLLWPSEQDNLQVPPMYCKKSITGKTEDFCFRSLGAMLQIVLTTTDSDITLSSIRISDATKPLSGAFTVSGGKAAMTGSGKSAIVLNTGETKIGNAAKYFNIAVPAGKYDNIKLTFFTNNGKGVAMYSTTMPEIQHNTVAKISLCAKNFSPVPTGLALDETAVSLPVGGHRKLVPQFTPADTYNKKVIWTSSDPAVATVGASGMVKAIATGSTTISAQLEDEVFSASCEVTVTTPADVPADALSGLFSVSDNKVVRFAKSNLCKKSDDSFIFFENQYDMAVTNQTEFITWGQLSGWMGTSGNQIWQVLSGDEWKYLFGDNNIRKGLYAKHVTVVGVEDCLIIYPDGYTGTKVTDDNRTTLYNDSATWAQAQNAGVVCLTPVKADSYVDYWVASDQVLRVYYIDNDLNIWGAYGPDTRTDAARPVTEVK
ncbi:MAG: Ig-like domain-containing protein [Bacteroidaceae bacterium]|nr:Ig-like domain-containing protein [Bacteroidaceae bacterium]